MLLNLNKSKYFFNRISFFLIFKQSTENGPITTLNLLYFYPALIRNENDLFFVV